MNILWRMILGMLGAALFTAWAGFLLLWGLDSGTLGIACGAIVASGALIGACT